jgi:hypothetical protein
VTGTVGELLVQLRLLQHDVQAAPPLKDSGNDLIAVRGHTFRAVQVRTTRLAQPRWQLPPKDRAYHLLALVALDGEGDELSLDGSKVYLIPRAALEGGRVPPELDRFALSSYVVDRCFEDANGHAGST